MRILKLLTISLCTVLILFILNTSAYASNIVEMNLYYDGANHSYKAGEINLMIDGRDIRNLPMPPVILNNYTLVPAREVFEQLGAVVGWNPLSQEVFISYGSDLVALQINNTVANINGSPIIMELAPKIINDKTMVPVRFASEALGFVVNWNNDSRTVYIDSPVASPPPSQPSPAVDISYAPGNDGPIDEETGSSPANTPSSDVVLAIDVSKEPIPDASYDETTVTFIRTPTASSHSVEISASSPISKVDSFLLPDNRLVVDIYKSEIKLSKTEYIPEVIGAVEKVWAAQNQISPQKITRVVLALSDGVSYAISISTDRKTITVDFEKNAIIDMSFTSDGISDYLTITGNKPLSANILTLSNPLRLVFDFAFTDIMTWDLPALGRFANSVRNAMFDPNTARIVIDLKSNAKYSYATNQNSMTIKLEEPTYKNIHYNNDLKIITLKKDSARPININSIAHTDNFSGYTYTLTLPGDYQYLYGYGEYLVHDANVRAINIVTDDYTKIIIDEKRIFAVEITEDNENIYIALKNPKEVYRRIVVLDPGHGGRDPGTEGQGVQEKALTLDISRRLFAMLESNYGQTGIKVYATRTDDTYVSRFDRAPYANEIGDLFVSIHINSASPNQVPNGTETYYYPHPNDNTIGISTKQTAEIFHKNLLAALQSADRKVKEDYFTVLLDTRIPSVLCEIGFISNPEEGRKLTTPEYRQLAAQALYDSIIEVFSVYTPPR